MYFPRMGGTLGRAAVVKPDCRRAPTPTCQRVARWELARRQTRSPIFTHLNSTSILQGKIPYRTATRPFGTMMRNNQRVCWKRRVNRYIQQSRKRVEKRLSSTCQGAARRIAGTDLQMNSKMRGVKSQTHRSTARHRLGRRFVKSSLGGCCVLS